MLKIVHAETEAQYEQIRELMAEYIEWDSSRMRQLGLNAQEFLDFYYSRGNEPLPGVFAQPDGCLLLATHSERAAGCCGFQRMDSDTCEMKRMYVRPEFRGMRIGHHLAGILIATAREAGYGLMRLETATFMEGALALYSSLGFRTCAPYYVVPESFRASTVFMELDLHGTRSYPDAGRT